MRDRVWDPVQHRMWGVRSLRWLRPGVLTRECFYLAGAAGPDATGGVESSCLQAHGAGTDRSGTWDKSLSKAFIYYFWWCLIAGRVWLVPRSKLPAASPALPASSISVPPQGNSKTLNFHVPLGFPGVSCPRFLCSSTGRDLSGNVSWWRLERESLNTMHSLFLPRKEGWKNFQLVTCK